MALENGIQANYSVQNVGVRLFDGSYHDVDSDQLSFELAAKRDSESQLRKLSLRYGASDEGRGNNARRIWAMLLAI